VHLHKVRLDEKPCLAGTAAAHDKHVFIPGVSGIFRAAVHHQAFGLRQQDVVIKNRGDIRLDVLCRSP